MFRRNSNSQFYVKSGDVGFADRQKSIFDQLAAVEKEQNARQHMAVDDDEPGELQLSTDIVRTTKKSLKRHRLEMKQFRGQESIFKRPEDPPQFRPKSKAIPDYHMNPHKWVKYSLGDVSQEEMSNHSNTAAAFSFLQEIAARKEAANNDGDDEEGCVNKIAFKRPKQRATSSVDFVQLASTSDEHKPTFKSSKLVMPEYVIGQSKKKERKRIVIPKPDKIKEIPLKHLIVEEEDIEDDSDGID